MSLILHKASFLQQYNYAQLKGNTIHGFGSMLLQESLKQPFTTAVINVKTVGFTGRTLLNAHHLNSMGRAIPLDNPTSPVSKSSAVSSPNDNIFVYIYSYSCQ